LSGLTLVVLGTAQDGGLPHAGCLCSACERARADRQFERLPASIGVVSGDGSLLIDATSAFERQVYHLWGAGNRAQTNGRFAPPTTIVLTHAHTGHYTGLWQLDRSVMAARAVNVVGTHRMVEFLAGQEPWALMRREGFVEFDAVGYDDAFEPLPGLTLRLLPVPHRSEWDVDTVGVMLAGPNHTAFYLPDIDAWDAWDRDVVNILGRVDLAIVDGCFWEPFHIPGVPHPPIRTSLERLAPAIENGRTRIVFTHLNHSNPVVDPASPEATEVVRRGFAIAGEGDRFEL